MVPAGNSSATSSISVTDTIGWIISFICWTAAYIQFHRSTLRYRTPCLPPLIYALNFAWELNLGLFTPPNRLLNIVYSLWAVGDLVLIHNQIRYGGIDLWGFVATLAVATATEAAVVKTCVSVLVSGTGTEGAGRWGWEMFGLGEIWQRKVMNGGMQTGMGVDRLGVKGAAMAGNEDEMARMMATFWLGYICQMGVSFWSLWIVSKGQGKHLEYSSWAARAIGSYSAGFLVLRRAWVLPEQHWWVTCPIGAFMMASTMLADAVWPAVRWSVVQKGAGGRMTVLVDHMGTQAVETEERKKV